MSQESSSPGGDPAAIHDCWNRIGVYGDATCPLLAEHVHCRNCPVYSAAAIQVLDRSHAGDANKLAVAEATRIFASEKRGEQRAAQSAFVFRIGGEWLALSMAVVDEVADLRAIHSLPHRRNGVVLGLANVRGELLVCVSLAEQMGIDGAAEMRALNRQWLAHSRLLVLRLAGQRLACPVDEVHGNERFLDADHRPVPSTVARASASYTRAMLQFEGQPVGLLDDELLFNALHRSLA